MSHIPKCYQPLIDTLSQHQYTPFTLAIDGRCGSGKTQLALLLAGLFPCNLFHMDDFYLPFEQRSETSGNQLGGHMDYPRLIAEVLRPTHEKKDVIYQKFHCQHGTFSPPETLSYKPLTIIEGSYSHHPCLQDYYHSTLFLTCQPDTQKLRLFARQGESQLPLFLEQWIPREEAYFTGFSIQEQADQVIDTTDFFNEGDSP